MDEQRFPEFRGIRAQLRVDGLQPGRAFENEVIDELRALDRQPERRRAAERAADHVTRTADLFIDVPPDPLTELFSGNRILQGRAIEPREDGLMRLKLFEHARRPHAARGMQIKERTLHRSLTSGWMRSRNSSMPRRTTASGRLPTFMVKLNTPLPSSACTRRICFTTLSGLTQKIMPPSICCSRVAASRFARRFFMR